MYSDTSFMIMIEDVKNDKNCWVWNLNIQQKCPQVAWVRLPLVQC